MAAHSKLGASSSHRWMECPGSIRLSKDIADKSSVFAMEGNAAHDCAEECLKEQVDAIDYLGCKFEISGAPEPFICDQEMVDAVQVYIDEVNAIYGSHPNCELYVEHRFTLDEVYKGMFGTCDAVVLNPNTRTLHVFDFKYGKGIPVEVEANPQLMYYGLGAALSFKGFDEIELVIVQPRAQHKDGPVRKWRTSILDLLDFKSDLQIAAQRTEAPDSTLKSGEHCGFCPARGFCPELRGQAEKTAMVEFTPQGANTPVAPNFLTPEQVNQFLRAADVMETWIAAVREYAHSVLANGGAIPEWKLVQKRANRVWLDEIDAALELSALSVAEDKIYTKKIVTPAAAEKLVPKKQKDMLKPLIGQGTSSGTTLARSEDPRPAVVASAENEFSAVE